MTLIKKWLSVAVVAVTALMTISGCQRSVDNLAPFGWDLTDETFDSVTRALEYQFLQFAPLDSIANNVKRMEQLAEADRSSTEKSQRSRYWRARLDLRLGDHDRGISEMEQLLGETDRNRDSYLWYRLKWNLESHEPVFDVYYYESLTDEIEFYASRGDLPFQADRCMALASMLYTFGDYSRALTMLDRADSLLIASGLEDEVANNAINRSTMLFLSGDTVNSINILRHFIDNIDEHIAPLAVNMAQGNLYVFAGDTTALRQAYLGVKGDTLQPDVEAIYLTYLAEEAMADNDLDAAREYINEAYARHEYLYPGKDLARIFKIRANMLAKDREWEKAYKSLQQGTLLGDSVYESETGETVRSLETQRLIDERVLEAENRRRDNKIKLIALIAGIAIAVAAAAGTAAYLVQRLKAKRANEQLSAEKAIRKVLAMEVVLEEKETLLHDLDLTIKQLETNNEITHNGKLKLDSALKVYNGAFDERSTFVDTFGHLHPDFSTRLKGTCQTLTEADLKLAAYIAVGIDNRHIARILSIRPESVRQARWRLSSKLGLSSAAELSDYLKRFQ